MNDEYRLKPGGHFASLNGQHARQSPVEIHLPGWKSQATQDLSSEPLFRCTRIQGPNEPEIGFLTSFRWRVLYADAARPRRPRSIWFSVVGGFVKSASLSLSTVLRAGASSSRHSGPRARVLCFLFCDCVFAAGPLVGPTASTFTQASMG